MNLIPAFGRLRQADLWVWSLCSARSAIERPCLKKQNKRNKSSLLNLKKYGFYLHFKMPLRLKCRFTRLKNFTNNQKYKRTHTGSLGLLSVHVNWLYVNPMFQIFIRGQAANVRCPMIADTAAGPCSDSKCCHTACGDSNLSGKTSHKP